MQSNRTQIRSDKTVSAARAALADRRVRVFVSSTFQDMQAERHALVTRVFPLLAAHCRKRQVEFVGVDLRWGITAKQSERGETVALCMEEIERCRPYFIGILAGRYGWVPDGCRQSVTEMEIDRVLEPSGDRPPHIFFYLRGGALTRTLAGATDRDARLTALKRRVRGSGYPVLNGYRSVEAFADRVLADLTAAVDADFPDAGDADPLAAEREAQHFYAVRQAEGFAGRGAELAALRAFCGHDGLLLITGEPGIGKTALLARWALTPAGDAFRFLHFAGCDQSGGWEAVVRRLFMELKHAFSLDLPVPEDREGLRRALAQSLCMAVAKGRRVVIALDGAQAVTGEDGFGLAWLPDPLPGGVTVVATLSGGDALIHLRERPHEEIALKPLHRASRRRMALELLAGYGKALDDAQMNQLTRARCAGNPLYLTVLLNELRCVGTFERLTEQIGNYLACNGLQSLLARVLARFDADYDPLGNALPARALKLLYTARGGLTERELIALLGNVPQALFAPLHSALEPFTAVSHGAIQLTHAVFRSAILARYLPDDAALGATRRTLAAWYTACPDEPRRSFMLPWLLNQQEDWPALHAVLCEPAVLREHWRRDRFELKTYWAQTVCHGADSREAGYQSVLMRPEAYDTDLLLALCGFMTEAGERAAAETLLNHLIARTDPEDAQTATQAHCLLGNLRHAAGALEAAAAEYRAMYRCATRGKNRYEQRRALSNLGLIAQMQGRWAEAEDAYARAEALARRFNQPDGLQIAIGNRGNLLYARGNLAGAETLYREQARLCRASGNLAGTLHSLGALGLVALGQHDAGQAERCFQEQADIARRIGAPDSLQNALGNLAVVALSRKDTAQAEALWQEKLALCRKAGLFLGEQNALGNLCALRQQLGDADGALLLAQERVALCRAHRALRQCAEAAHALACAYRALARDADALAAERQASALARQNGFADLLRQLHDAGILE